MDYGILLDPNTGDLPVVAVLGSGIALIAQRVRFRLALNRGDTIRNASLGLPWVDWLSAKPVRLTEIENLTRQAVEGVPGVTRVENWSASFEASTKAVTITGQVYTSDGEIDVRALTVAGVGGNLSFMANFWGGSGPIAL